ncbi:hypothetical protein AQS70_06955 [Pseudomonas endophytica]|uniref:Uncharacterized protein n=1 Tax=Pseudomonas endophytica TaxID=1563157 RepID=A0A0N8VSZ5_9PSED|nr:hypothetical protein [Pseudomonas endophytica]KQB54700.1 hypothetical protein AQS70_06955 [Pseudomonas endophytica]
MTEIRADFLMNNRAIALGVTTKRVDNSAAATPQAAAAKAMPAGASVNVSLSAAALEITALLHRSVTSNASAAEGFDPLMEDLHLQLSTHGKEAQALQELPKGQTQQRIALSMQASNYLLTSLYGGEKLHHTATSNNPFRALDRLSLSNIAFDASGSFTSIERQVAFLDLTARDIEFRNQTFDLPDPLNGKDFKTPWNTLASHLRDAQMAAGMSEGERTWRGWMPAHELHAHAQSVLDRQAIDKVDFPTYSNLKSSGDAVLTAVVDKEGVNTWINIPVKQLITQGLHLGLIESALDQTL